MPLMLAVFCWDAFTPRNRRISALGWHEGARKPHADRAKQLLFKTNDIPAQVEITEKRNAAVQQY